MNGVVKSIARYAYFSVTNSAGLSSRISWSRAFSSGNGQRSIAAIPTGMLRRMLQ
jgi:hypothetical protein